MRNIFHRTIRELRPHDGELLLVARLKNRFLRKNFQRDDITCRWWTVCGALPSAIHCDKILYSCEVVEGERFPPPCGTAKVGFNNIRLAAPARPVTKRGVQSIGESAYRNRRLGHSQREASV